MHRQIDRKRRLFYFSLVDIHHHLEGTRGKAFPVVGNQSDVQSTTEDQQEVAVLNREIPRPIP